MNFGTLSHLPRPAQGHLGRNFANPMTGRTALPFRSVADESPVSNKFSDEVA